MFSHWPPRTKIANEIPLGSPQTVFRHAKALFGISGEFRLNVLVGPMVLNGSTQHSSARIAPALR
jgi:hypothetical protein